MKNNNANITGSGNQVVQGVKNSKITIGKVQNNNGSMGGIKIAIWTLIITILGMLISIIVGWDSILKFFGYVG